MGIETQNELFPFEARKEDKKLRSYMPSCFIICPLPVRSTKPDIKVYERKYNGFRLRLVGPNGVPGGKIARDMLMLFATEAVYQKNFNPTSEIDLSYNSISTFAKSIGINYTNHYDRIIKILEQYSACSIYFDIQKVEKTNNLKFFPDGKKNLNDDFTQEEYQNSYVRLKNLVNVPFMNKLQQIELLRDGKKKGEPISIDIQLTPQFADMVRDNAVPVDFTIYKEMESTLEKDLYVWLVYRNNAKIGKDGIFIPRNLLVEQFGEETEKNERMKYLRIISAIKKIRYTYYEQLNFEVIDKGSTKNKGVILYKSPLLIKENDLRYVPLLSL